MVKRFLHSRRTGFYFAVAREGMIGIGNVLELIGREQEAISVADVTRLYGFEKDDVKTLRRALEVEALPQRWKDFFQHQLERQKS